MMSEMEPPPASRLRRRSFFENMETESSSTENVSLSESDLASALPAGTSSQSPGKPSGKVSPSSSHADVASSPVVTWRLQLLLLFLAFWQRLVDLLQKVYLSWATRFPDAATRLVEIRDKLWNKPRRLLQAWRTRDNSAPVKHWEYPTHWLAYASVSLVVLQLVVYSKFQTVNFDLRVHECVFRERLLSSAELLQPAAPPAAALRFLERRFEQQYRPGVRQSGQARLPWTCLAVVPTGGDAAISQASELAFLWPRSQVVSAATRHKVASRVHVAVGANPLDRTAETQEIASAGVFAALFPLNAMRPALFTPRFPDLVLVKTEFALRQMLKFRQERQEERDHRGRTGALNTLSGLGRNSPAEQLGASDLAASNFGVYLLKTTVPDVYDRHVRKKWDEFLHVVVVGDADKKEQFTEELLAAWVAHPTWPMLHVRFQQSLALCGSFQRVLSSMLKDYEADAEAAEAAEAAADPDRAAEDWLDGLDSPKKQANKATKRKLNVDLVCEEDANSVKEITRLKNAIGMHLFPVPPEVEKYETMVLESAAVGAVTVTYNTPIMQEWVPDSCGLRVGSFDYDGAADTGATDDEDPDADKAAPNGGDGHRDRELTEGAPLVKLPSVHVTSSEIEHAVEQLLELDRVSRVAAGRAARVHYLRMRTHYLSAVAALDAAVCEGDSDDLGETQSEIGQHSRKKVEVETLRAFLY
ncbi:hypothetical protein PHYBOEH_009953 [Phytophthora boehmeriae]|uniref:Uncharacterized protein n=1 Tax=Phytophthora boehmeriae TaxID=109152 RepID=A0A8T1VSY8_9STRA|nr:hypothetical protein PHYBOEH_009953 [Phytophthora boehmeriae]